MPALARKAFAGRLNSEAECREIIEVVSQTEE